MSRVHIIQSDAGRLPLANDSVALVMTSPPYADARTYGIGAQRECEEWIDWMLGVVRECVRVCIGATIINCAGVTRDRCYWPGPEGLLYRAWKEGIECYRPVYWHRVGIPGSGGKDWFRADVEYCLAFKRPGKLPWHDNTACGHPPKWAPGGEMANRLSSGKRVNQLGPIGSDKGMGNRFKHGDKLESAKARPSHMLHTKRDVNGDMKQQGYSVPVLANPGNLLRVKVGGGHLGHTLAHENEAPFPVGVPEFFVKSLAPLGSVVLDPFSGSGTTASAAIKWGRVAIASDLRMSQCSLTRRRTAEVQMALIPNDHRTVCGSGAFTVEVKKIGEVT